MEACIGRGLNDWIHRHDNAPAHKELSLEQFLVQKSITGMEHPPYSRDFTPNDLRLFPRIRYALKGSRFQDAEDIKINICVYMRTALKAILQLEFRKCFQQW